MGRGLANVSIHRSCHSSRRMWDSETSEMFIVNQVHNIQHCDSDYATEVI